MREGGGEGGREGGREYIAIINTLFYRCDSYIA